MAALSPGQTDIFMKIDDISAFVAVVRNQSVSAAADALGLTQSAITRRVQSFEHDLGAELLDRSVKPPRPSPTGRRCRWSRRGSSSFPAPPCPTCTPPAPSWSGT